MTDFTLFQRIMAPALNWLVEKTFPRGAFYGREYFDIFRKYQKEDGTLAQASTLWITHAMHEQNADQMDVTINGLTISGERVGDFQITVTRVRPVSADGVRHE